MGFLDVLGRMINGDPMFDEQSSSTRPQGSQTEDPTLVRPDQHDPTRTDSGIKIFPELKVSRVNTHRNGTAMTTSVWIENEAPFEVELRKFTIMGRSVAMGRRLQPHSGHEEIIYSGAIATDDKHTHASIDYRIVQNGDYFQQEFFVEFDRQADGTYLIEELHPEHHVRDT